MDNVADEKFSLRRALLDQRRAVPPDERRLRDAALSEHVVAWCRQHDIASLGVYCAIRGEPDLAAAYAALAAAGVALALPVVRAADAPLRFAAWRPGAPLLKDGMGVPTPADPVWVATPQALLIPCVGYNDARCRLGYGGGFYDRTLAAPPRPRTLGVAYREARADFAALPHDVALDAIATEHGVID